MRFNKFITISALALGLAALTNGCAYRSDLAQGNFVEQEAVSQLRQGMTTEQVQFILGTPMLTDPFDNSRWYYVHYLRKEWDDPEIKNLVLRFEGRSLVEISGDFATPPEFYSGVQTFQKIASEDMIAAPASEEASASDAASDAK